MSPLLIYIFFNNLPYISICKDERYSCGQAEWDPLQYVEEEQDRDVLHIALNSLVGHGQSWQAKLAHQKEMFS